MHTSIPIKSINDIIKWNLIKTDGNKRRFFFRGMSNDKYKLIPKISRNNKEENHNPVSIDIAKTRFLRLKQYLNVYLPAYGFGFEGLESYPKLWRELFVAQHYGIPTNLLDFSRNPLVALFFAAKHPDKNHGAVYAIQTQEKNPTNNKDYNICSPDDYLHKYPYEGESGRNPFFVAPTYSDKRIIAQVSVFCYLPMKLLSTPLNDINTFCSNRPNQMGSIHKLIVDKKYKGDILEELNKVGINDASLFPDMNGLGSFIEWKLLNKYS
ncbi:MAG: FRG domain-containing protein [Fulvivirga sp.]